MANETSVPTSSSVLVLNEAFKVVYMVLVPMFVLVGFTGNYLAWTLIRSTASLRQLASNTYLLALAVFSSLFLATVLVVWVDKLSVDTPIFAANVVVCKCVTFVTESCDFASVWLIVLICLDRALSFCGCRRILTTKRQAVIHIWCLVFVIVVLKGPILYILTPVQYVDLQQSTVVYQCTVDVTIPHIIAIYEVYTYIDLVLCCALPTAFICVLNLFIMHKLRQHYRAQGGDGMKVTFNTEVKLHPPPAQHRGSVSVAAEPNTAPADIERIINSTITRNQQLSWKEKLQQRLSMSLRRNKRLSNNNNDSTNGVPPMAVPAAASLPQRVNVLKTEIQRDSGQGSSNDSRFGQLLTVHVGSADDNADSVSCYTAKSASPSCTSMTTSTYTNSGGATKMRRKELYLTRTLLVITTVFVVLNLPYYLFRIVSTCMSASINLPASWFKAIAMLVYILLYLHHAILFYVYIFYSPQMKKKLVPMFLQLTECKCLKKALPFTCVRRRDSMPMDPSDWPI